MKFEDYKFERSKELVDEKDIDIERWRSENPVDYLKIMHLINSIPDKNIAFKSIYSIMQLYVPETLYKYYSLTDDVKLNEQKFETLNKSMIFTNEAKWLNDPFDNKAYYYNHNKLKKYTNLKEHDGRLIDDFSSFSKVAALTSNEVNSMPMWAHYSNNHQGFCVSYDMKEERNLQLRSCTFPVQYTDQRTDITSIMVDQVENILNERDNQLSKGIKEIRIGDLTLVFLTALFVNIKHTSWSYENEFRCTLGISDKISPYVTAFPKEIYIGLKCIPKYRDELIKIGRELDIPIYQMVFSELNPEFTLVSKRL